jgi:hypothetical protein
MGGVFSYKTPILVKIPGLLANLAAFLDRQPLQLVAFVTTCGKNTALEHPNFFI